MFGPVSMKQPATTQITSISRITEVLASTNGIEPANAIIQATNFSGTSTTVSAWANSSATAMIGSTTPQTRAEAPSMAGKSASVIRFCTMPMTNGDEGGDGSGLGRREDAGIDAAEDDERDQQRPFGVVERRQPMGQRKPVGGALVAADAVHDGVGDHHRGQDHARRARTPPGTASTTRCRAPGR